MSHTIHPLPASGPWPTEDPFLFCVHHLDHYPAGNAQLGPVDALTGRPLGMDFSGRDGWSMYHGRTVPGFPMHPHRGFETITIVSQGLVDHADSMGASARYGNGDVQWLTAGDGIQHSEMFPLLNPDGPNTADLFQIWLNLPAATKRVAPHFTMIWADQLPTVSEPGVSLRLIAGPWGDQNPPAPPPSSYGAEARSGLIIWTIALEPGAKCTLPAVVRGVRRNLYHASGGVLSVDGQDLPPGHFARIGASGEIRLEAGDEGCELLLLGGHPIGEPVAHHGPFVMNSRAELFEAFEDYRRTQFGGWSFDSTAPTHGPLPRRFARHPDGRVEEPGGGASPGSAEPV